jgi:hypothetical protein
MGNHSVGRALAAAAEGFWEGRENATQEQALRFLDKVAEPWISADAEFDDELNDGESTALGRLVALAMGSTKEELNAEEGDDYTSPWFDGPYQRFQNRYKFC